MTTTNNETADALRVEQDKRRCALIERLGTIADLTCQTPLEGALGDVVYDLLRQAAAQISSDRQHIARHRIAALSDRAAEREQDCPSDCGCTLCRAEAYMGAGYRDALTKAEGERDSAREALHPFAVMALAVEHTDKRDGEVVHRQSYDGHYLELTKDDFRRAARAALPAERRNGGGVCTCEVAFGQNPKCGLHGVGKSWRAANPEADWHDSPAGATTASTGGVE